MKMAVSMKMEIKTQTKKKAEEEEEEEGEEGEKEEEEEKGEEEEEEEEEHERGCRRDTNTQEILSSLLMFCFFANVHKGTCKSLTHDQLTGTICAIYVQNMSV